MNAPVTAEEWVEIEINGVKHVPKSAVIPDEAMKLLHSLYCTIWAESYYDPYNDATKEFASGLAPKMKRLNELLRFKR